MDGFHMGFKTAIGFLHLEEKDGQLTNADFREDTEKDNPSPLLEEACRQLSDYFEGKRRIFDLPLFQPGTIFQKQVWDSVSMVAFGSKASYLDIAVDIGNKQSIRAVGTANGSNRLAIFVPCHRIVATDGKLTGYAWGLWRKKWLLDHEAKFAHGVQSLFPLYKM
jgi:methylated-DNA-[protein]-cysteine S-methyltransferase